MDKRAILNRYKVIKGCAECGFNAHPAALQFAHIDEATKYRVNGKPVQPSNMVHRYSWTTVKAEIAKCRVLCANCHMIETHG